MLTYSPEGAFVVTLFELVVSGLSLVALLWIRFWEEPRARILGPTIAACALLSGAFALQGAFFRIAMLPSGHANERYLWLLFAANATRVGSSVALVAAYLPWNWSRGSLRLLLLIAAVTVTVALSRASDEWIAGVTSIDPLTSLRVADLIVLGTGAVMLARSRDVRVAVLVLLFAGRASAVPAALWPQLTEACWAAGHALVLAGLILLALTLERESERRLLHYVLRFNLIFLTLAVSLIGVLTEIGRRQFIEFSAVQIRDVAEFARGHLIHRTRRGDTPATVFAEPQFLERLVREFGRYPDLRRIRLELNGHAMDLEISESGEIGQWLSTGARQEPPPVAPLDFMQTLLLREAVAVDGKPAGSVALYHSIVPVNTRIGQQMQLAFGVFTLFVAVGSAVTGILVHLADRTIRRQNSELAAAQRRLLQLERLASLGAVAGRVAHEINNPAGVLVARSDYLLSVVRGKPYAVDIQEDLDTIGRQAQRLARTVRDVLDSTRGTRAMREPVSVTAVMESAIKLVQPVVRDRDIAFALHAPPSDLLVLGDRDRLEQVFINLLSNAAQASPQRGVVTVETALRDDRYAEVTVIDTGVGIPPEHLDHIFDRFFTTKEPSAGSGLGLWIARDIVDGHGGQIAVESTVGVGTKFTITLPTCAPVPDAPTS